MKLSVLHSAHASSLSSRPFLIQPRYRYPFSPTNFLINSSLCFDAFTHDPFERINNLKLRRMTFSLVAQHSASGTASTGNEKPRGPFPEIHSRAKCSPSLPCRYVLSPASYICSNADGSCKQRSSWEAINIVAACRQSEIGFQSRMSSRFLGLYAMWQTK